MPTVDLLKLVTEARRLGENTKRAYANAVRQWLVFAGTDPAGWTKHQAQAFYNDRATRLSVKAVNNVTVVALRYVFKRANELYDIPNIALSIDTDRVVQNRDAESNTPRAWTAAQARAVIAACEGKRLLDMRDRAAMILGAFTGMRRMTLTTIRLDQVFTFPGYVTFRVILKGQARYDIPLDARAWALTEPYRRQLAEARKTPGPMFPRIDVCIGAPNETAARDTALTNDGLYKALMGRIHTAGVPGTLHTLRHTFVTWCVAAGVDDRLIEAVTGHITGGTIRHVYTDQQQLYPEAARRCYEAIATRLEIK